MPRPWLLVLLLFLAQLASPQSPGGAPREILHYNIEWRLVTAGKVLLDWRAAPVEGQPGWQVDAHIESIGLVSKPYK